MIISQKHKFAFIKTRKTAGSSIEKILYPVLGPKDLCSGSTRDETPPLNMQPDTNGHLAYDALLRITSGDVKRMFSFTVERNPWDKCVSAYYWHKQIKPHLTINGFNKYLKTSIGLLPTDWEYYTIDNKVVAHVFKYEELDQFIPFMNDKFNFNLDPNLMSTTKMKSGIREQEGYRQMYDEESMEFVSELFKREIKEFGYEF